MSAAASLNMHDLWTLRGVGIKPDQFPMILGCDGAGRLADGTEVVLHPVIGDPGVAGDETLDPKRSLLTEKYQGTFADTVVVPARNAVPKPAGLSMAQAAVMGTAWLTAYRMLFVKSGLRPGQTMLVQGASGGVATALVQLGHAAGMQVWVTGRSDAKRAVAERLGADATFPSGARLPARVDAVFETVGEATWAHSMRALKPGGTIVVSGSTSGPNPGADLQRLFFLQLRVIGATMGTRGELADLLAFVATAGITPEIGLELPMEQAEEGFRAMLEGDTVGKDRLHALTSAAALRRSPRASTLGAEFRLGFMPRTRCIASTAFIGGRAIPVIPPDLREARASVSVAGDSRAISVPPGTRGGRGGSHFRADDACCRARRPADRPCAWRRSSSRSRRRARCCCGSGPAGSAPRTCTSSRAKWGSRRPVYWATRCPASWTRWATEWSRARRATTWPARS